MPTSTAPLETDLWRFSLDIYGRPGVQAACLDLQDRRGLDVNVLLFALWCAASGRGPIDADLIQAAATATADWSTGVVRPLRAVRRCLKGWSDPPVDPVARAELRAAVAAAELLAERIEQAALYARLTPGVVAGPADADRLTGAALLALAALPAPDSVRDAVAVGTIVGAIVGR